MPLNLSSVLPMASMAALSGVVLSLLCLYFHWKDRDRSMRLLAAAWLCYSVRVAVIIGEIVGGAGALASLVGDWATVGNSILLVWGGHVWLNRSMHRAWPITAGLLGLALLVEALFQLPYVSLLLHGYTGFALIATGVLFSRLNPTYPVGGRLLSISLVLWGIHKLDYPLAAVYPASLPWGFMLAALLAMATGVGFLLLYLEQARHQLAEAARESQDVLNQVGAIIARTRQDGTLRFANRAAQHMMALPDTALRERPIVGTLLPELDASGCPVEGYLRAVADGTARQASFICDMESPPGRIVRILWNVSPILGTHESDRGLLAVGADLTARKQMEDRLEATQQRLLNILQNLELVAVILDERGRIQFCNRHLLRATGWTEEEVLNGDWFALFLPPEHRDEVYRVFLRCVEEGDFPTHYVNEIITRTGERRLVAWSNTLLRDTDGEVVSTASIGLDITETKRSEEALIQAQHRNQLLIRIGEAYLLNEGREAHDGLAKTLAETFTSPVACLLLREKPERWRLLGSSGPRPANGSALALSEKAATALETILSAAAGADIREDVGIELFGIPLNSLMAFPMAFRDQPGLCIVGNRPEPYQEEEAELLQFLMQSTAPVIQARVVQEQIKREQARLTTAIEQTAEAVMITDTHGTILYVNPAFERMTGYTRDEALGKTPKLISSGQHDEPFYGDMWQTLIEGKVWSGLVTNRKKGGSLYEEEMTVSPVFSPEGTIENYVAIKKDVTSQLLLERRLQQDEKLKAIGTLAGGIAHDFNNVLGAIIGYAQLIEQRLKEEDGLKQDLGHLLAAAGRARALVRQILTFSRRADQVKGPVSIAQAAEETLQLLRPALPHHVDVEEHLPSKPLYTMGDGTQLHQVIMNLCTNAIQAMQASGGRLRVNLETHVVSPSEQGANPVPGLKPGPYAALTVEDTGTGMDSDVLQRAMEPFFTTKPPGEGTGMGLATAHSIALQHGGTLVLESKLGQGTRAALYLPLISPPDADVKRPPATLQEGAGRILAVDDERPLLDLMNRALSSWGYSISTFASPTLALEHFRAAPDAWDLIITDLSMPEMNGIELARQIKKLRPDLPILLASGYAGEEILSGTAKDLFTSFIAKPVTLAELNLAISSIFAQHARSVTAAISAPANLPPHV